MPEFVVGDSAKPLRRTFLDDDGNVVDVSLGEVRLFATGVDNGDHPTSNAAESDWEGVLGVFVTDGSDGAVDFEAIGSLLDIGTVRSAQLYRYRLRYTSPSGSHQFTSVARFIARRSPLVP
jgi:hypothetical protein